MQVLKKVIWVLLLAVSAVFYGFPCMAGVPGLISFQGQLTDDMGDPVADGVYTMRFYLFDAALGGNQVWNSPNGETQDVTVTNGVYNVQLGAVESLDPSVFEDDGVWLEVVVGGETLSPRQRVTATAYSLRAGDADTLEGSGAAAFAEAGHDHDTVYVNEGQSNSVSSAMIANETIDSSDVKNDSLTYKDIADGAGSQLDADYLDGLNSSAYFILNQSETVAGRPFFYGGTPGSTPPFYVDSDIRVTNLNADKLDGYHYDSFVRFPQDYGRSNVSDNLYEGTTSLTSKYVNESGDTMDGSLTISTAGNTLFLDSNPLAGTIYGFRMDVDQSAANNWAAYGSYATVNSSASSAFLYGSRMAVTKDAGTGGMYGSYTIVDNNGTGGTIYGSRLYSYNDAATGDNYGNRIYSRGSTAGNVYALHADAYKDAADTDGTVYGGFFEADNDDTGASFGVYAQAIGGDGTNTAVRAIAANGDYNYGVYASASDGTTAGAVNWAGYFYGRVGIDTYGTGNDKQSFVMDPANYTLRMYDGTGAETLVLDGDHGSGSHLTMKEADGTTTVAINADSGTNAGPTMYMYNNSGDYTVYIDGDSGDGAYVALRNAAGSTTIQLDADYGGDGRITTQELRITGGSDLSEQFDVKPVDIEVGPGMVVSIDPESPGNLQVSTRPYDNRVAGIISGANGIKPGMMMGQDGTEADGQHPIALTGRVYCWADASSGPIEPGDLLTTSPVPGHAMKAMDRDKAFGATLGKAMTSLKKGKGLVLVLVSLQ